MVTCDTRDRTARTLVQHPCLIIEVLSSGTEAYDRGEKFKQYRKIDTLEEYVLVNAESRGVEVYRLNAHGKWELTPYDLEAETEPLMVTFESLNFECAIAAIYEAVEFFPDNTDK